MMNLIEIPPGYRFSPTDEEIITYYLRLKVEGEDMTWFNHVITEQDLYGELPPWVFFQDGAAGTGDDDQEDDHIRYFYTKLKKKHESGEKIHRTFGKKGEYCWEAQDKGNDICDHRTKTVIGRRKQYSFIRSNQKRDDAGNSNSNNNEIFDECFGHWIMHEYSLVNDSKNNHNYVLCRIRMKAPPKPTTITTSNAAVHDHAAPVPSTTNDYQNMSYPQQQQQQDCLPDSAHVTSVPPLAHIGTDNQMNLDNTIEDDHLGYSLQHAHDQQDEELQQLVMLLYDQEQPAAPMEEWLAPLVWDGGDGLSSSYHDNQWYRILDDNEINHDQILLVDLSKNMEPLPPIILPKKSMVDQKQYYSKDKDTSSLFLNMSTRMQEEERRVTINIGCEGIRSDDLDYSSTTTIANGVDDLNNGRTEFVNFEDLVPDTGEYNTFWENHWAFPPPLPPSIKQLPDRINSVKC